MPLRLAVVEDDARYATSLELMIHHAPGYSCVATFRTGEQYLQRVRDGEWDIVLMDIELPGVGGIECTRETKQLRPELQVVMLTSFDDSPTILAAICAGADGYLLKKAPPGELLAQIASVAEGNAPLTGGVAGTVLDLVRRGAAQRAARQATRDSDLQLAKRQLDVLRLLVEGLSYEQVADELGVSIETVRTHIKRLYRKLQVNSVSAAVSRAIRDGLV